MSWLPWPVRTCPRKCFTNCIITIKCAFLDYNIINLFTLYKIMHWAQYKPTVFFYFCSSSIFLHATSDGMPAKNEKAKVLHYLEACFQPMTPTNEPVANIIDGNVQLNVLSPRPDNFHGVAEMVLDRLSKIINNLGRRFGTSKMHLSSPPPPWLRLLSVLRRWFCCCWLFVYCYSHCGSLQLFYVLLYVALCPF